MWHEAEGLDHATSATTSLIMVDSPVPTPPGQPTKSHQLLISCAFPSSRNSAPFPEKVFHIPFGKLTYLWNIAIFDG